MAEKVKHMIHINGTWCNQIYGSPVVYNLHEVTCLECLMALEANCLERLDDMDYELTRIQDRQREIE